MTSTTVKCSNCNVVICEVLAFLQNVLDFMDEDSIHQLCTSSFKMEEISKAKSLLYESLPCAKRQARRKDSKKRMSRDLDDIICLLKSTDQEMLPIFVAKELHKLPPVTFDHVDVTRLLKDILKLQNQVNVLEEKVTPIIEVFDTNTNANINVRRGAYLRNSPPDSGPIGLQYISPPQKSADNEVIDQLTRKTSPIKDNAMRAPISLSHQDTRRTEELRVEARETTAVSTSASASAYAACFMQGEEVGVSRTELKDEATAVSNEPVKSAGACLKSSKINDTRPLLHRNKNASPCKTDLVKESQCNNFVIKQNLAISPSDIGTGENVKNEWQTVKRKNKPSYRYLGQRGAADCEIGSKFKAADRKIPMFITNIHKDASEKDISDYINIRVGENVILEKINMKKERHHNAYKFFVSDTKLSLFMDENLWPKGIIFRRFVHFKYKYKNYETPACDSGTLNQING